MPAPAVLARRLATMARRRVGNGHRHPRPRTGRTALTSKVCIYGAGAIGGWIGVKLAQAGAQVSVVARSATLQAFD